MPPLSPNANTLLHHFVSLLPAITPGAPETYTGYRLVHEDLGWERIGIKWSDSLKYQGLIELTRWLRAQDLPAITGLAVNQITLEPGWGYFSIHMVDEEDMYDWWKQEITNSKALDWVPVLDGI